MVAATERVPVLMTPEEKHRLVSRSKKAGLSMGEYLRRAAANYRSPEDEQQLETMIDEMNRATDNAERAIEDALSYVEASNKRILTMESEPERHANGRN